MDLQCWELGGDAPKGIAVTAAGEEGPEGEAMMAANSVDAAKLSWMRGSTLLAEDDAPEAAMSAPALGL